MGERWDLQMIRWDLVSWRLQWKKKVDLFSKGENIEN